MSLFEVLMFLLLFKMKLVTLFTMIMLLFLLLLIFFSFGAVLNSLGIINKEISLNIKGRWEVSSSFLVVVLVVLLVSSNSFLVLLLLLLLGIDSNHFIILSVRWMLYCAMFASLLSS
jgi:hypothetical protein